MDTHLGIVVLVLVEPFQLVELVLVKHVLRALGLTQQMIIAQCALKLMGVTLVDQLLHVPFVTLGMRVMEIMDATHVMLENILQPVVPVSLVPMVNGPFLQVLVVQSAFLLQDVILVIL